MQYFDIMANKKEQLAILVPYLEKVAALDDTEEPENLPVNARTTTLINRCLHGWEDSYIHKPASITPEGAFLYYLTLTEKKATNETD